MTTPVIIDITAAAVLLGLALLGARRGLFKAVSGLVITIASLIGASLIASLLAPPAARLIAPMVQARAETRVEAAMESLPPLPEAPGESELSALLDALGLDSRLRETVGDTARDALSTAGASMLEAVTEGLIRSAAHGILYILSFAVLSVLLRMAAAALDLVLKLPGLHGLNALGGFAAGLAEGALLLILAVLVLRLAGTPLAESPWSETLISRILSAL